VVPTSNHLRFGCTRGCTVWIFAVRRFGTTIATTPNPIPHLNTGAVAKARLPIGKAAQRRPTRTTEFVSVCHHMQQGGFFHFSLTTQAAVQGCRYATLQGCGLWTLPLCLVFIARVPRGADAAAEIRYKNTIWRHCLQRGVILAEIMYACVWLGIRIELACVYVSFGRAI
jgi:hypothetical protein